MTPDGLRTLSLRTFKATVSCIVVGIVVVIAIPNSTYRASTDSIIRIIGMLGLGLLVIALLTNFVSLLTGAVGRMKGAKRCPWIIACALVYLVPGGIWVAAILT
jgi:hypothetical protein